MDGMLTQASLLPEDLSAYSGTIIPEGRTRSPREIYPATAGWICSALQSMN